MKNVTAMFCESVQHTHSKPKTSYSLQAQSICPRPVCVWYNSGSSLVSERVCIFCLLIFQGYCCVIVVTAGWGLEVRPTICPLCS